MNDCMIFFFLLLICTFEFCFSRKKVTVHMSHESYLIFHRGITFFLSCKCLLFWNKFLIP